MTEQLTWYGKEHDGEPLLFLPTGITNFWGGGEKRSDFAPEIQAEQDYPALAEIVIPSRCLLVTIVFKNTQVLVLVSAEPCSTTWVSHAKGGFLVQAIYTENEKTFPDVLANTDLYAVMDKSDEAWEIHEGGPQEITVVPNSGYLLMNSLDVGPDDPIATEKPLPIEIAPGTYNIKVGRWMPDEESEYLIYRLSRED